MGNDIPPRSYLARQRTTENNMHKLNIDLEGVDGNTFALIAYFKREARRAGWSPEEITKVLDDAMSEDYNHLLQVLINA